MEVLQIQSSTALALPLAESVAWAVVVLVVARHMVPLQLYLDVEPAAPAPAVLAVPGTAPMPPTLRWCMRAHSPLMPSLIPFL